MDLGAYRPQADLSRSPGDVFFEVIHIGKTGDTRADQLQAGDLGAQPDEFGRDELALDRHHETHQPHIQAQVIRQPAQQRHRHVGVGVDQTRHQHFPAAVDGLLRLVLLDDLLLRTDRQDAVAGHCQRARLVLVELLVQGEHAAFFRR